MTNPYYSEHSIFVDNVKRLLDRDLRPHLNEWENAGMFPDSVFTTLGREGYLGILIPEDQGGSGGDYKLAAAWCEAFGELPATGLVIGVNMHSLVIANSIARLGSEQARQQWLPGSLTGERIGAYAFTEPGAGSDLANIRTTAQKKGSQWIINGSKTFITNGARANYILVLTRTDMSARYRGFTTFVVDTTLPGFRVAKKLDKLGWRSSDTAELLFDNVAVDESAILGRVGEGWAQASNNLSWERLMLALTTLGGMRACLRETWRYAQDRSAFGKKISEFGTIHTLLERMYLRLKMGEALTYSALDLHIAGKPCRSEAALAKRIVCDDAVWLADRAIQIHGGYGYTTEFPSERWLRDLRLMPIGGGTSEIMAEIVAKEHGWQG